MSKNELPLYSVSPAQLSTLDKFALLDLLQHKTQLLIAAYNSKIAEQQYLRDMRKEVEDIQAEIKRRLHEEKHSFPSSGSCSPGLQ